MYKKINIYYKGVYICSTNQSKTCKEAKEKFIKKPYCIQLTTETSYKQEYCEDLKNNCIDPLKVKTSFK